MCDTGASIEGPIRGGAGPFRHGPTWQCVARSPPCFLYGNCRPSERDEVALVGFKEVDDEMKAVSEAFMDRRRAGQELIEDEAHKLADCALTDISEEWHRN